MLRHAGIQFAFIGGKVAAINSESLHLSQFLDYLRVERAAAENTIVTYSRHLKRFFGFLEIHGKGPKSTTRDDVRAYLASLYAAGLSGSGVAHRYAVVRSFYRFMRYSGVLQAMPTRGIRTPKFHAVLVEHIPDPDVTKMLAHLAGLSESPIVLRNRAMIQMFYDCGLRVSELRSLRLVDMQLSLSTLRVIGKGDKQRLLPVSPRLAEALRAYLERGRPSLMGDRPEHGIVFVNARQPGGAAGGTLSRMGIFRIVRQLGRDVLGRDIHPHQLRHSFGSTLIEHGADPRNVQALMGHADIETTMRYVHVDMRTIKEVHRTTHPRGDLYVAKECRTVSRIPANGQPEPEHHQDIQPSAGGADAICGSASRRARD
jgi:integrase/recombinase XerD